MNGHIFWDCSRAQEAWAASKIHLLPLDTQKTRTRHQRCRTRVRRGTRRPTRLPARRTASAFFFFFFFLGFAPTRLDSCRIGFDSRRIGLIRPKSSRIGHIGSYRPAADTAEIGRKTAGTGRKRPKSALNMAVKAETCILLSFFVNQGIVCVF